MIMVLVHVHRLKPIQGSFACSNASQCANDRLAIQETFVHITGSFGAAFSDINITEGFVIVWG